MRIAKSTFLGSNQFIKSVDGCTIALTAYTGNMEFEEWHSHESASISLLVNGSYKEDLSNKHYKRTAGDIKFIHSGEEHRCHGFSAVTKKINLDVSNELLKKMHVSECDLDALVATSPHVKLALLRLYRELSGTGHLLPASAQLLLYELLYGADKTMVCKTPPGWVKVLKEILHDEWDTEPDLHALAHTLGLHPVTLSGQFRQYFPSTLSKYIRKIKVDRSLTMIKSTSLSLTQIAYACGFADQAHFTRTFKEMTGFLPKDFRKI